MAIIDNNMVHIGTQINLAVESEDLFDGFTLFEVLDNIVIYSSNKNKSITLDKDSLKDFSNENKCIIKVNTSDIGLGTIKIIVEVLIPDGTIPRKEVYTYNTGIYVVKSI